MHDEAEKLFYNLRKGAVGEKVLTTHSKISINVTMEIYIRIKLYQTVNSVMKISRKRFSGYEK